MSVTRFGLIGHPVAHSLSPFIHEALFKAAKIRGEYRVYDISPAALPEKLPDLMKDLAGFNCTIPHKQTVIPYLEKLDQAARHCRSVNTVWQNRGYNTDYRGFLSDCPSLAGHHVLILGAGGVSRTMAYAAVDSQADVWIWSRRPGQAEQLAADIKRDYPQAGIHSIADLSDWLSSRQPQISHQDSLQAVTRPWTLLNGTPLGLWPKTAGMPFPPEYLQRFSLVYDTIYNPVATRLVLAARNRNIPAYGGLGMLFKQAVAAQQIWHAGLLFNPSDLAAIRSRLARAVLASSPLALVLVGFMGSGKTTVGKLLARSLNLPFTDLDQLIEQKEQMTIQDIFASAGEPAFRALETRYMTCCLEQGQSQVIATGGGALLEPATEQVVRAAASQVIYLDASIGQVLVRVGDGSGRPLIQNQETERILQLYAKRQDQYARISDLHVNADPQPGQVVDQILDKLGLRGESA